MGVRMFHGIWCFMVAGIPLTGAVSNALLYAAYHLMREEKLHTRITGDGFEGEVRTEHKGGILGGTAGIVFEADVDTDRGSTRVRFLVPARNVDTTMEEIEEGRWIVGSPIDMRAFNASNN